MATRPLLSGFSRQLVQTLSLTLKQLRYLPSFKFKSLESNGGLNRACLHNADTLLPSIFSA
ncbi:hypothetical protein M413DRAFT_447173 [Hebeloma cylindrosporum]|uniref:Uncharacterized protein n=1 Tax=Hebeloma cylindrosporum TaxID=76867 RepID=A0A0C3BRC5_HEBCY|nr:hypothetical protein M413DRAFT_447173 [Hebeloma cylindrosporum h7]